MVQSWAELLHHRSRSARSPPYFSQHSRMSGSSSIIEHHCTGQWHSKYLGSVRSAYPACMTCQSVVCQLSWSDEIDMDIRHWRIDERIFKQKSWVIFPRWLEYPGQYSSWQAAKEGRRLGGIRCNILQNDINSRGHLSTCMFIDPVDILHGQRARARSLLPR